jgi:uracil-DNA glycosylase family 4
MPSLVCHEPGRWQRVRSHRMIAAMPTPLEVLSARAETCRECHAEALLYAEGGLMAYPVFQKDPPCPVSVLAVAEAPNFDDCFDPAKRRLTVEPGTDPSGAFAWELLSSVGLRPEDVLFTNSVLCLPKKNGGGKHAVSARQQTLCARWLGEFIDVADPLVIVAFGGKALEALERLERHGLTLRESAGRLHPWRGRHLLALYHPGRLGRVTRPEAAQREDISVLREFLAGARARPSVSQKIAGVYPDGARLALRSRDGREFTEIAFKVGVQLGRTPVFAFQIPRRDGPPFWDDQRVFIEGLVKRGDNTIIACRHEGGICEIEANPLTDEDRAALREWTEAAPHGVVGAMAESMNSTLDPRRYSAERPRLSAAA